MREISDHKVNPVNDRLKVYPVDEPGSGGAHHLYEISGFSVKPHGPQGLVEWSNRIGFQNGPISEGDVNGLTDEVLLAIIADRLRSFQAGPYSCKAHACALTHIEEAMHWLQQRTLERMRRGVEGTHKV